MTSETDKMDANRRGLSDRVERSEAQNRILLRKNELAKDEKRNTDVVLEIQGCFPIGRGSRFFKQKIRFDFLPRVEDLFYFEGEADDWAKVGALDWFLSDGEARPQLSLFTTRDFTEDFESYLKTSGWLECDEFSKLLISPKVVP